MKTVKQTVDVAFKYAEIKDVINLLPLMNLLSRECACPGALPTLLPIKTYKILRTLLKMGFIYEYEPVYSKDFVLDIAKYLNVEEDVQKHIKEIEARNGIPNYANILKDLVPDE